MKKPPDSAIREAVEYLLKCIRNGDFNDSWHATTCQLFDINVWFEEETHQKPRLSLYAAVHKEGEEYPETGTGDWYTVPCRHFPEDLKAEVDEAWRNRNKKPTAKERPMLQFEYENWAPPAATDSDGRRMRNKNRITLRRKDDGRITYSREFKRGETLGSPISSTFEPNATAEHITRLIHWGCCGWDEHPQRLTDLYARVKAFVEQQESAHATA